MITKEKIEAILEANESCIDGYFHAVDNYTKVADEIMKEVKKDSTIHNVSVYDDKYILTIRDHSNDNYIGANKSPEYLLERENMGNPKRINLVAIITE